MGPCRASTERWTFDKYTNSCEIFYYGGCCGNGNKFFSKEDCENKCVVSTDQGMQWGVGTCDIWIKIHIFVQRSSINMWTELQKVGILVSRIPDVSGKKFGHFQIVAANLSIFGIQRLQHCWFMAQFNSKCIKLRRKLAFVQYHSSCCVQSQKTTISDIFKLKTKIPDEKSLFATLRVHVLRSAKIRCQVMEII